MIRRRRWNWQIDGMWRSCICLPIVRSSILSRCGFMRSRPRLERLTMRDRGSCWRLWIGLWRITRIMISPTTTTGVWSLWRRGWENRNFDIYCCKIYHFEWVTSRIICLLPHIDDDLQIGVDLACLVLQLPLLMRIEKIVIWMFNEVLMSMQFRLTKFLMASINACFEILLDPLWCKEYLILVGGDCAIICSLQIRLCLRRLCYFLLNERRCTENKSLNSGEALQFLQTLIPKIVMILITNSLLMEIFFNFFHSWLINSFAPLNPKVIQSIFKSISYGNF